MKFKRTAALMLAVLSLSGLMTGCGGKEDTGVDITLVKKYISEDEPVLQNVLAEQSIDCTVTEIATGDTAADPTGVMGSMMKLAGMITTQDIDILIASLDEGKNQANMECLLSLSELFTEEELAGFDLVSFELIDENGVEGVLHDVPCGIRLYDPEIASIDESGMAVYIISNTEQPEESKEARLAIAELYAEAK